MLNDRVVFYKSELSDDSAFVIQTGGEREVAMDMECKSAWFGLQL